MRGAAARTLEVALAAGAVATLVLGVLRPILGPAVLSLGSGPVFGAIPSVPATMDLEAVRVETTPGLPDLADAGPTAPGDALELTIPHDTTIGVYDPDGWQVVSLVGPEVLAGLLSTAVLVLLLLIVRTLRTGDPFLPANARRLYLIAGLVGLGGQAAVLLRAWGESAVLSHPVVAPYVLPDVQVSLVPLVAGLGVAVAAEVFRQGAALREDLEGVV